MKKIKKVVIALLAVFSLSGGIIASAGTSYGGYSVVVGKFNQSTKTSAQTKTYAGKAANLKVTTLGRALDARAYAEKGGTGNWVRISTTGTYNLPNNISAKDATRIQFSTDLTTLVNVAVKGTWRSN